MFVLGANALMKTFKSNEKLVVDSKFYESSTRMNLSLSSYVEVMRSLFPRFSV